MQTTIISVSLILFVMGYVFLHSKIDAETRHVLDVIVQLFLFGVVLLFSFLELLSVGTVNFVCKIFLGLLCVEYIYVVCLIIENRNKKNEDFSCYDYSTSPKYFITGDKHRNFKHVEDFCRVMKTCRKDVLIILGDAGFNYYGDGRDEKLKKKICNLNITLFCIQGNKENRPQNIATYGIRDFCGGKMYYEPKYPNIYFAKDGEIYTFEGKKYIVVGGAHSVDKIKCLENNWPFFEDEMPDDTVKQHVEDALKKQDNRIYGMLTHTCPLRYLPTEMFMSTRQNAAINKKTKKINSKKLFKPDIDRSTEEWLDKLENRIDYKVWFCGHYHIDKQIDKINMMCHEIRPLHMKNRGDN